VAFIIVGGLRDVTMGGDTKNYFSYFNDIPILNDISKSYIERSDYQPLFNYYLSSLKTIFDDFNYALLAHSIIVNSIVFWFLKRYNSPQIFLGLCLYLIINFLEFNMEIMRESLAVCCGLIAYNYYSKSKWVYSIIWGIISVGFHISALILIIFPFLQKIKYSKKLIISFLIIGASLLSVFPLISEYINQIQFLLMSSAQSLADKIEIYNNSTINQRLNIYYFISLFFKNLMMPLVGILLLKEKTNKYIGFIVAYYLLMIISSYTYAFYRFGNYFAVFNVIFLSNYCFAILQTFKQIAVNKLAITFCFLCIVTYVFEGYQLGLAPDGHTYLYERYIPYKFYFEN